MAKRDLNNNDLHLDYIGVSLLLGMTSCIEDSAAQHETSN